MAVALISAGAVLAMAGWYASRRRRLLGLPEAHIVGACSSSAIALALAGTIVGGFKLLPIVVFVMLVSSLFTWRAKRKRERAHFETMRRLQEAKDRVDRSEG